MDEHTIALLEFSRIKNTLHSYCLSEEGKRLLSEQRFLRDVEEIRYFHNLVSILKKLFQAGNRLPDVLFPMIETSVNLLSTSGIVLDEQQQHDIAVFCESSLSFKNHLLSILSAFEVKTEDEKEQVETLKIAIDGIPSFPELVRTIRHIIDVDGTIKENLPELKKVKDTIRTLNKQIQSLANGYLNRRETSHYWQDTVPVQREGRTVLPLKANFRGRVNGIVHEVSSTGATLFIEPYDIVEKSNALIEQQSRYRQIVHRLLRETTEEVQAHQHQLRYLLDSFSFIDTIISRSMYCYHHNCNRTEISNDAMLLQEARHPLLGEKAVPIDISLPPQTNILIISGPNTGGKTVTLKTIGLLVLLHQFGMEIPAAEGSMLPIYDNVFVDIGDEQSIDQSLSTFSGHMKQISRILEQSTPNSLLLLDELGAGTDVQEGGCISMALLDYFLSKNCTVIATTHQGILKHYGFTKDRVDNASVDFDAQTLTPRYSIIYGIPGDSHAIEIAKNHGIPSTILTQAKQYRSSNESDVAKIIRELSKKQKELREKEHVLETQGRRLREEQNAIEKKEEELAKKEVVLRNEEVSELHQFLRESRQTLENLVREVREGEINREKTKSIKLFLENINEKAESEEEAIAQLEETVHRKPSPSAVPIEKGMEVLIGKTKQRGTVINRDRKGKWIVATNSMRITADEQELIPTGSKGPKPSVNVSYSEVDSDPEYEIDVRGLRLEDALDTVKKQIDKAVVSGLSEFHIIHGMGKGVLQEGIHDYLGASPHVNTYEFAHPSQGGFGKTIVKLGKK